MIQRFHATDDLADMQSSLMRDGAVIIEKVVGLGAHYDHHHRLASRV